MALIGEMHNIKHNLSYFSIMGVQFTYGKLKKYCEDRDYLTLTTYKFLQ